MSRLASGLAAGLAATVPMTAAMQGLHRLLPDRQRYPQDPRLITDRLLKQAGVPGGLGPPREWGVALIPHFGYGAACGAAYGLVEHAVPLPPVARGIAFGALVWAASYAGWLPALGILPRPSQRPAGRDLLVIASHVVWGAALGLLADRLGRRMNRRGRAVEERSRAATSHGR